MARQHVPTPAQQGTANVSAGTAMLWAQAHHVRGERGGWLRDAKNRAIAQGWDALAAFLAYSATKRRCGVHALTVEDVWADRIEISPEGADTRRVWAR